MLRHVLKVPEGKARQRERRGRLCRTIIRMCYSQVLLRFCPRVCLYLVLDKLPQTRNNVGIILKIITMESLVGLIPLLNKNNCQVGVAGVDMAGSKVKAANCKIHRETTKIMCRGSWFHDTATFAWDTLLVSSNETSRHFVTREGRATPLKDPLWRL
jgi:hypothetical protein